MDIQQLVNLTSRAWALPILAAMHDGVPGRQAALVTSSGAGRTAFQQSMTHLIDMGLIARNSGHGHPLRPEFVLTPEGKVIAAFASRAMAASGSEAKLIRRAWTVPIIAQATSPRPFSSIRKALPITDRALSLSLQKLETAHWIRRDVDVAARPPKPLYLATGPGAVVGAALSDLGQPLF